MAVLKWFKKILDTMLAAGAITSLTCMVAVVIIQVYSRFFMDQAPSWTEEAARIFFIYTTAFASGLALERNAFVSLGLLDHYIKGMLLLLFRLLVSFVSTVFAFLIAYVSLEYVEIGGMQTLPTMRFITMDYVLASITIMMGMVGLYGLFEVFKQFIVIIVKVFKVFKQFLATIIKTKEKE